MEEKTARKLFDPERIKKMKAIFSKYGIIFVLIGLIIVLTIISPKFLSAKNLLNVMTQVSIFGIMALGMTLIITSKGIDLSAGSVLAFSGMAAASLAQITDATTKVFPNMGELSMIIPVLVALAIGASLRHQRRAHRLCRSPPFIATLGMQTIVRGFALMYTGGKPISSFTDQFMFIGARVGPIPVPLIIYILAIGVTWILLGYTRFGKSIYAIGGNVNAAEISGINVKKALSKSTLTAV